MRPGWNCLNKSVPETLKRFPLLIEELLSEKFEVWLEFVLRYSVLSLCLFPGRWWSFFHFILRFWNQIFTCLSDSCRLCAISILLFLVKYLLKWNSFSSSSICWRVYAVLFRLESLSINWSIFPELGSFIDSGEEEHEVIDLAGLELSAIKSGSNFGFDFLDSSRLLTGLLLES